MEEKARAGEDTEFQAYSRPLEKLKSLKYLGNPLTVTDYDWSSVISNIQELRKSWSRILRILGREGADTQKLGNFYLAIVKAVLLFGAETWVVSPHIERLLWNFHYRLYIVYLKKNRQTEDRTWE